MKISFLHHTYPGIGGTETVTNLLAYKFIEKGWDVTILAWKKSDKEIPTDFTIEYLPDSTNINSYPNSEFIYSYLKRHNIDCLINQGPFWIPTHSVSNINTVIISALHYSPYYKIESQKSAIIQMYQKKSSTIIHLIKSTVRFVLRDYFAKRDFDKLYKGNLHTTIINSDVFTVLCSDYIDDLQRVMGGGV